MATAEAKETGSYYTPANVASSLVRWVVRSPADRMLDPSCGDGQFLFHHRNSTGVEQSQHAAIVASRRAPGSMVHVEDFFAYVENTKQRFECAAGNPPFIRYQRFAGTVRERALAYCRRQGVELSGLSSSWAPFLVATASLLKPGGRMAFVVPAEIGHAPYAAPFLQYLCRSFTSVHVILIRESVFDQLSQDIWLLFAQGHGGFTNEIKLTDWEHFRPMMRVPRPMQAVSLQELSYWRYRLRPFLLSGEARQLYQSLSESSTRRLGDIARVGIGYVTGDNDFFHMTPSKAKSAGIPPRFLIPTVRSGRTLTSKVVDHDTVATWISRDEPCLLLHLRPQHDVPRVIHRYLESAAGKRARQSYKCRNRTPWYAVPDVVVPDGFLTYMSGNGPSLAANAATCTCTNSIHAVRMKHGHALPEISKLWDHPLTMLSAELEGHPLGGGMLKLEPREAVRIMLPQPRLQLAKKELQALEDARATLRLWRHYG